MSGKNMRRCCDTLAKDYADHNKGCVHSTTKNYFISMDNSTATIRLEKGLFNWLTERKLRLVDSDASVGGLGDIQTIVACDGIREGVVLTVEFTA